MWPWLQANWLALYGAVVATVVAFLSGLGYLHKVRHEAIRLKLSCEPSPKPPQPADSFVVTVTNDGAVPVPLAEAGVIDTNGEKHPAQQPAQGPVLASMARWILAFNITLEPHDSASARVLVKKSKPSFNAKWVYAMRKDGREVRQSLKP